VSTVPAPARTIAALVPPSAPSLLDVRDLHVSFQTPDGVLDAVRGLSFSLDRGRVLGIVGESGSGKSVATQTMVGLTRGAHDTMTKAQARTRAIELLGLVGIARPERRVDDYPHHYSGGMLQRAMIAMALSLNPSLLIADEPTTALDVTVQAQIIRLLRRVQREFGTAIIMITHDLGVVADIADDVMVMYAGRAMEAATRDSLFQAPSHPYTRGLFESSPRADVDEARLTPIPGQPPSLLALPAGCAFQPRCSEAIARCVIASPHCRRWARTTVIDPRAG
jgi:oligopeptide/dipeptide ABC transporter ATP-binding protein